jgi:hypothetical protein
MNRISCLAPVLALALVACSKPADTAATAEQAPSGPMTAPADAFLAAIAAHCGKAFAGRIVANEPQTGTPDAFEGKPLVMHVRGCSEPTRELSIPFHVGDDRSRTWVLTRTADGLRLKHDHRHEDGSPDASTLYGGDTAQAGTAMRQEFPVGCRLGGDVRARGPVRLGQQYLGDGNRIGQALPLRALAPGRPPVPGRVRPGPAGRTAAGTVGRAGLSCTQSRQKEKGARWRPFHVRGLAAAQRAPKRARQPPLTQIALPSKPQLRPSTQRVLEICSTSTGRPWRRSQAQERWRLFSLLQLTL